MKIMIGFLDAIFVSFCVFLMVGYHGYLWYCFKKKPFRTTIGTNVHNRRIWFLDIMEDVEKNGMLGVQTLRNTQMVTILNASFAIILNTALAALTNNSYKAIHVFNAILSGSKSGEVFALKYGLASFALLLSFFCSSVALAFFMDASFLINANLSAEFSYFEHSKTSIERGNLFAIAGNRLLLVALPLVMWTFGPLPVVLSSLGLVWWLHELDFAGKPSTSPKKCHSWRSTE